MKLEIPEIQKIVEEVMSGTSILTLPKEFPQEVLVVPLLRDSKSRDYAMNILILEPENLEIDVEDSPVSILQFYVGFPLEVPAEKLGEMITLMNVFNQVAELPGFAIVESMPFPFFRYTLITKKGQVEEEILLTLVGMITGIIESYSPIAAALVDEEKSLLEIIKEF